MWIFFKIIITACLIVLITELVKFNDKMAAIIAAMPIVTTITLIWLYIDNVSSDKISTHAYLTFFYVIPTLPMFLVFPIILNKFGFILAIFAYIIGSVCFYFLFSFILKIFNINI